MRLALLGYGAMGKLIESLAKQAGDEIVLIVDEFNNPADAELIGKLRGTDAAIDFSIADAVKRNVSVSVKAGVPIVVGTTGWLKELESMRALVAQENGALVYGANFSIGVNIFYRVAQVASEMLSKVSGYEPYIHEAHHSRKKDAPSGTGLKLKEIVARSFPKDFSVSSTRAGHMPGTHDVGFDSAADTITLTHQARSREGFASGALWAAKWIKGRRGVYEFTQAMDEFFAANASR
jgi:4-hydroxy-tetrahydrodipicolinate reductase